MRFPFALSLSLILVGALGAAEPVVYDGLPPPHDTPMRRFGEDRFRVPGSVNASAITADGKRLAVLTTSQQRSSATITIFDVATRRALVISRLQYGGFGVFTLPGLCFSHDGKLLAVALNRETTFVIATDTGREVWRAKNERQASQGFCAFDPAGRLIRTFETETWVTEIPSGKRVAVWAVGGLAKITPDAKTYVRTKKVYTEIEIGDTATGRPRHILPLRTAQNGVENGYAISHDGRTLAVLHAVSEIHLIDLATGATKRKWELPKDTLPATNAEFAIAFTPDDRGIAFSTHGGLRRWQLEPFQELPTISFSKAEMVKTWHTTHDGQTLLIPRNGIVERWNAVKGERLVDERPGGDGYFGFTPDGKQLITSDRVGRVGVWDTATGVFVRAIELPQPKPTRLFALAVSPDGKHLAIQRYADGFEVLPLNREASIGPWTAGRSLGMFLTWSPDSRSVFGHENIVLEKRRYLARYDMAEKRVVMQYELANPLTLTPDGKVIVFAGFKSDPNGLRGSYSYHILKKDIVGDRLAGEIPFENPTQMYGLAMASYSPDGRTLALSGDQYLHLLGRNLPPIVATDAPPLDPYGWKFGNPNPLRVNSMAFTPNGQWLVSGGDDCSVKVWEVATGKLVKRIDGHDQPVVQVAVAGDGRSVFASGGDGFVNQWSLGAPYWKLPSAADELFALLGGSDPAVAVPAAWQMMGDDTLRKFALAKQPAAAKPDAQKVAKALADLDAPAFADRTAATKQLADLGRTVERELRDALAKTASVETRERIEGLIARFEKKYTADELRALRLVAACEWHKQKEPLTTWATGAPTALLTREAKAALGRMK